MNVGKVFADFSCGAKEETVAHLHNGCFMYGANLTLAHVFSVLKGKFKYSFRGGFSDEFDGLDDALNNAVLDTGIFSLCVLPD